MRYSDELLDLLQKFQLIVFGRPSTICETEQNVPNFVNVFEEPIAYFLKKETLLEQRLNIITKTHIPRKDFYLVNKLQLDAFIYEQSGLVEGGGAWRCIIELTLKMLLTQITAHRIFNFGGIIEYVEKGGLFSAREIVEIMNVTIYSEDGIKEKQAEGITHYKDLCGLPANAKNHVLQKVEICYPAMISAQISTILWCANKVYMKKGYEEALDGLRIMAEFRQ